MSTTPNLGPATVPFTPTASCLETTTYRALYKGSTPVGFTLGMDADCFPPATSTPAVTPNARVLPLYSPGLCPASYWYALPCKSH